MKVNPIFCPMSSHPLSKTASLSHADNAHCNGILVVGLRPGSLWNQTYQDFLGLVEEQVKKGVLTAREWQHTQQRTAELAELDRVKTDFFSNFSHEFRTPLTLITATDTGTLTRNLCSAFRSSIEKAGLSFQVDCCDLPELVYLDRDLWERIVLNLLSNALKFTFEGSIEVRQWADQGQLHLEVCDTGSGMEKAEIQDIFKRFHRGQNTRGRTYEGSGIGLSLVDEFVALHGGHIEVTSAKNQGLSFRVHVPLGQEHLPPEKIRFTPLTSGKAYNTAAIIAEADHWTESVVPLIADDGRRPLLLIVDDNKDMLNYLQSLLAPTYDLRLAADGETAFHMAQPEKPDLILSDVMMPRWDGNRLLQALRSDRDLQNDTHALSHGTG